MNDKVNSRYRKETCWPSEDDRLRHRHYGAWSRRFPAAARLVERQAEGPVLAPGSHPPPGRARADREDASEAWQPARAEVARTRTRHKRDRNDYRSRCAT